MQEIIENSEIKAVISRVLRGMSVGNCFSKFQELMPMVIEMGGVKLVAFLLDELEKVRISFSGDSENGINKDVIPIAQKWKRKFELFYLSWSKDSSGICLDIINFMKNLPGDDYNERVVLFGLCVFQARVVMNEERGRR